MWSAARPRTAPRRPTWSLGSPARPPGLLAGGGRAVQALRELLPCREHRVRQRDGGREPPARPRSDRGPRAAATKPYGFMAFHPGAGVGGHCIPCDPHYLLENLRDASADAPIRACDAVDRGTATQGRRAGRRAASPMREWSRRRAGAGGRRLLQAGSAGHPRVARARDHPRAGGAGVEVAFHDPLVRTLEARRRLPCCRSRCPARRLRPGRRHGARRLRLLVARRVRAGARLHLPDAGRRRRGH